MTTTEIFTRLWQNYTTQNPETQRIYDLFTKQGEIVENDHIAFRTFDNSRIGIDTLATIFVRAGYTQFGEYHFTEKHLFAKHYENKSEPNAPRVFISQLITADFSAFLQETVRQCVANIPEHLINSDELLFAGNVWGKPSFEVYNKLRIESEYAAWLYIYGFCANHFTVSINKLKKFDSIEKVNQLLKDNGFLLNNSGGEIKGTKEELLQQSSSLAGVVEIYFLEGKHSVPACYYEFAFRYPDTNGELYSGFIAKSADKIFESTNFYTK